MRNGARRIDKLQPISLPQFTHDERWRDAPFPEKTHDIFFSGAVDRQFDGARRRACRKSSG